MRRVCITQIHFIRNVKAVGSHLTATGTSLVQQIERQCVFYIYKFGAAAFSAVVMNRQRIITCCSKKICCKAGTRCTRNLWHTVTGGRVAHNFTYEIPKDDDIAVFKSHLLTVKAIKYTHVGHISVFYHQSIASLFPQLSFYFAKLFVIFNHLFFLSTFLIFL